MFTFVQGTCEKSFSTQSTSAVTVSVCNPQAAAAAVLTGLSSRNIVSAGEAPSSRMAVLKISGSGFCKWSSWLKKILSKKSSSLLPFALNQFWQQHSQCNSFVLLKSETLATPSVLRKRRSACNLRSATPRQIEFHASSISCGVVGPVIFH